MQDKTIQELVQVALDEQAPVEDRIEAIEQLGATGTPPGVKRRIIIDLESELAGFGKPPLKEEYGIYQGGSSLSGSDLRQPEIIVRYHPSESPADLADLIYGIVNHIYKNGSNQDRLKL